MHNDVLKEFTVCGDRTPHEGSTWWYDVEAMADEIVRLRTLLQAPPAPRTTTGYVPCLIYPLDENDTRGNGCTFGTITSDAHVLTDSGDIPAMAIPLTALDNLPEPVLNAAYATYHAGKGSDSRVWMALAIAAGLRAWPMAR